MPVTCATARGAVCSCHFCAGRREYVRVADGAGVRGRYQGAAAQSTRVMCVMPLLLDGSSFLMVM